MQDPCQICLRCFAAVTVWQTLDVLIELEKLSVPSSGHLFDEQKHPAAG